MNYYQRIQRSIDYIEENLGAEICVEEAAAQAFLSAPHYYRLFPDFTGYSYKEYVRKRRLSESLEQVAFSHEHIADIAFNSGFNTQESFARAFRKEFGMNPSEIRKDAAISGELEIQGLLPIVLVTEYYDDLVIKYLDDTHVICNTSVSAEPERDAWHPLERWAKTRKYLKKPCRIFGFENPPPPKMERKDHEGHTYFTPVPGVAYGYEFQLTVSADTPASGGFAKKVIPSGRYAVMSAESTDYTIEWKGQAWARMLRLIEGAQYVPRQYDYGLRKFEEHVQHFPVDEVIRLDLYIELEQS